VDEPGREALGRRGVTGRELEVLDAVAEGLTNSEIAARLCVSERTVESHVASLLHKLDAGNRVEAARWAAPRSPAHNLGDRFPHLLSAIVGQGVCVGRDEELERLLECWEAAAERTTVAVVRGEPGIGKSRLAAGLAVEVHRRGGGVALGVCSDGPQRPYEPFMAAIEADAGRRSDVELDRLLGASRVTFARLSPAIAARLGVVAPDIVDPERERAAVHGALGEYLSRSARAHKLLFVIEDLHWASVGTRDVVAHIARSGGDAPLMLLITTRDERPFVDEVFGHFLGRLAVLPSVEMIALSGLDLAAAANVIAAVGGDLDPAVGVRQTGGNPLFLRELAREGAGSRSLGELVADRFNRISQSDLDVVDVAAVAGEQIDVSLIASTLDRGDATVLDALERAEAVGLIGAGARPGRFAFAHDVYRSVRYASLTASRRFRLHAALAQALSGRTAEDQVSADLARHACLAGPRFDPALAADLARRAGDAATEATDHSEAAAHYRRALDALELSPGATDAARLELTIRLGASLVLLGDVNGQAMLRSAAQSAHRCRDFVALADAVCSMAWSPGGATTLVRADPLLRMLAEAALDGLPASEEDWRIRVQAALGVQLLLTDAPARGTEMIQTAVDAARRLGDPITLGRALLSYRLCGGPLDIEQRIACGTELIEIGDQTGLDVFGCVGRQQLWWCHRELGDRDEMDRWYESSARLVRGPDLEQLSHPPAVALMDGDLARAEQLIEQFSDLTILARGYAEPLRMAIADNRGHTLDPAKLERWRDAGMIYDELLEAILARAWARRGQPSRARELLDRVRRDGFPPMYSPRGGAMTICCWAEAAAIVDDSSAADELGRTLEPLAGRLVESGALVWDTIDRVRALLRLVSGEPARAAEIAASAVAASRRRRTPIFLARELIVLAAAKRRIGVNASETASAVDEALTVARRTGARIVNHDARLLLPSSDGSAEDHFGLTPREREILEHVAAGETNAQIAAALGISPATVRKHLEHAYEKLHVSTRTAAAVLTGTRSSTVATPNR
jgi:DNA-binding NarL/FixJ family response regulator